jgi:hypothetical protein
VFPRIALASEDARIFEEDYAANLTENEFRLRRPPYFGLFRMAVTLFICSVLDMDRKIEYTAKIKMKILSP